MNRCGGGKRRVGIDSATYVVAATLSSKGLHWRGGAADRHGSPKFLNPSPTIQTWSPISATQHCNRRRHSRRHGHKPASRAHAQTRTSDITPTRAAYTPTRVFPSNGPQIQTTLECSIPDCHTQVCNILSHNTVGQKSQARSTTPKNMVPEICACDPLVHAGWREAQPQGCRAGVVRTHEPGATETPLQPYATLARPTTQAVRLRHSHTSRGPVLTLATFLDGLTPPLGRLAAVLLHTFPDLRAILHHTSTRESVPLLAQNSPNTRTSRASANHKKSSK